jgi:alkanesulfonate monooxygenase SsuD/methylene tetrahydromethanopterin reductase-like flavin-dependent oxidoreductase (luciferase family)
MPVSRRVSFTDEGVEVLKRCFTGEKFSFHGKRYRLRRRSHRPGYVQQGGPPLVARGDGERRCAARRETPHALSTAGRARSRCSIRGATPCARRDDRATYRVGIIRGCLVTDDASATGRWCARRSVIGCGCTTVSSRNRSRCSEARRRRFPQSWIVGDVNHCVAELVAFIKTYGITDIVTWGVPPGIRPQDMTAQPRRVRNAGGCRACAARCGAAPEHGSRPRPN